MTVRNTLTVQATDAPFSLYDAFTERPYSGSPAAIVLNASSISPRKRALIAREIGVPATAFVDAVNDQRIKVQFFSTVMELPMCGHGTVCLITRLVELGLLLGHDDGWCQATLDLPKGSATVEYRGTNNDRYEIMLDVATAQFAPAAIDLAELAHILGVDLDALSDRLPVEVATADFIHLCLPFRNLEQIGRVTPDFAALTHFCHVNGLETVAAFSTETTDSAHHLHVRDFCPAVGVAESAGAGTTNAALAVYLLRNDCVKADATGTVMVRAEQGVEIDRPSEVTTRIQTNGKKITRLQVGGVASRMAEGVLNVAQEIP